MEIENLLTAPPVVGQIFKYHNQGSNKGRPHYYMVVSVDTYQVKVINLYNSWQVVDLIGSKRDEFIRIEAKGKMRKGKYAFVGKVHTFGVTPFLNELIKGRIKYYGKCLGYELVQIYDACSVSNAFSKAEQIEFENSAIDLM
jgi:hypothetical protein